MSRYKITLGWRPTVTIVEEPDDDEAYAVAMEIQKLILDNTDGLMSPANWKIELVEDDA